MKDQDNTSPTKSTSLTEMFFHENYLDESQDREHKKNNHKLHQRI